MASKKKRYSERLQAATGERPSSPPPGSFRAQEPDEPLVQAAAFVGAAIIGLLVIMGLAILFGVRSIESHLETQALGLLRANGLSSVEVDADGIDMVFAGTVSQEDHLDRLPLIIDRIEGVGDVDATNVVYAPPPEEIVIEVSVEPLVFIWGPGGVTVSGTVSDEQTRAAIVAALEDEWDTVVAEPLVVRDGVPPERDWLPTVIQVVRRTAEDVEEGNVIVNPELSFVLVAGELEERRTRTAVSNDVEEILNRITFAYSSGLTVAVEEPPPPTSTTVLAGGTTTTSTSTTTTTLPPIVVELQVTLDELLEGKVVEFQFGSAVITRDGRDLLNEVLEALRMFPEIRVEIGGHTDNIGSDESNLVLSRLRANAVLSFLVNNGEPANRFQIVGYGEAQPLADNSTAAGQARNRRIEFTALAE